MPILILLLAAGLARAAETGHHGGSHAAHKSPSSGGAGVVSLDLATDGDAVHLLLGRPARGKQPASLWLRTSKDSGTTWSPERPVGLGLPAPYRTGMGDARLAARGKTLVAMWSKAGEGPMGTGALVVARSTDGGLAWSAGASPDGGQGSFGRRFPALAAAESGLHAVWIDRSDKAWLRYARSTDWGASWSAPASLDPDICECCWNAVLPDGERIFALYRGKGPRDMETAFSKDSGATWSEPSVAGRFGWKVSVCPHTGGALARAESGAVHAVVWTGAEGVEGLHQVSWNATDEAWGKARPVGDPAARHADLAASGERLALVWDRGTKAGGVHASLSVDGGRTWSAPNPLSKKAGAAYPRLAVVGAGFIAFWLEKDAQGQSTWRSAKL